MEPTPPEGLGSRDRILWAAATMLGEGPGAILSVRNIAARAGVSPGSLRHHFPTQRALMDTVLPLVYDMVLPEDSVHDSSLPARDRLVARLRRLLAPAGDDADPRESWRLAFERYVDAEPTEAVREEYLALEREMARRVESCLAVLQNEGALPEGDTQRRVRFLMTVVNGLSIAQALPADASLPRTQTEVLNAAADAVLTGGV